MPLLQFLAYYQTLEFYFPTYSAADARRRVLNVLKDPAFRADRDADIARIVSSIAGSDRPGADERSSLRATVRECVDRDELRAVLESSDEIRNTFSGRIKGVTDVKVPIAEPSADLRDPVADRIYDIRCRIVHTKSPSTDSSKSLLLPFSEEEKMLHADIELLKFIARKVLIAGSSTLRV